MKIHNFSAGPAILPATVFEQAAEAVRDLDGIGLSILEISHRSPEFVAILDEAQQSVKDLLGLGDDFDVLFLTGGASSQFFMTAMNLLGDDETAGYVDTGTWSAKAIKEAARFGNIQKLASSKDDNYTHIPKGFEIPKDLKYLHLTNNNTVFGTEFHALPDTKVPFVADMSSNIFSRPVDVSRYDLIYAGAQKNLGPAGVTLVIVRKGITGKLKREIPTMLDYDTHIAKNSMFNTPPTYPIYVCLLTMRWLKAQGGVAAMSTYNDKKAKLVYDEIDSNPLFEGTTAVEDRSRMNATFKAKDDAHTTAFLEACKDANISGIKGHRSAGGFRASIYNAMPLESVQVLVDVMRDFSAKNG